MPYGLQTSSCSSCCVMKADIAANSLPKLTSLSSGQGLMRQRTVFRLSIPDAICPGKGIDVHLSGVVQSPLFSADSGSAIILWHKYDRTSPLARLMFDHSVSSFLLPSLHHYSLHKVDSSQWLIDGLLSQFWIIQRSAFYLSIASVLHWWKSLFLNIWQSHSGDLASTWQFVLLLALTFLKVDFL